jgi:hypothetical protein
MKVSTIKPALKLKGEASRFKTLAEQAALRALVGPVDKRPEEEKLAREHALRSETFATAAKLVEANAPDQQCHDKGH